jgi:2'-5' RNA ligase
VSEEDRLALVAWAREAVGADPGMRVVSPESIHLTVAFLGHRALDEIEPLSELVEGFAGWDAPALRTAGALWLSPRRPHVLTIAVKDESDALFRLHGAVWDGLEAELGIERERRPFRPHLTVARVRHGWQAPSAALPPAPERPLRAEGVALVRSWLGGGPARYETLARADFAAVS